MGDPSGFKLLMRATGVPKYKMVGSIVLCICVTILGIANTALSESCDQNNRPRLHSYRFDTPAAIYVTEAFINALTEALLATSPWFRLRGICKVVQDGARSRYRTDDLFHEVEAVKAFPTANNTKLESVVPASSQTMMDLVGMESTTSSMGNGFGKGGCYQMLPSWKRGTL